MLSPPVAGATGASTVSVCGAGAGVSTGVVASAGFATGAGVDSATLVVGAGAGVASAVDVLGLTDLDKKGGGILGRQAERGTGLGGRPEDFYLTYVKELEKQFNII